MFNVRGSQKPRLLHTPTTIGILALFIRFAEINMVWDGAWSDIYFNYSIGNGRHNKGEISTEPIGIWHNFRAAMVAPDVASPNAIDFSCESF
jgi:hypothetical protein